MGYDKYQLIEEVKSQTDYGKDLVRTFAEEHALPDNTKITNKMIREAIKKLKKMPEDMRIAVLEKGVRKI